MSIELRGEHPHQRFTHIPEDDETRMCLDPWSKVFIKINGDVAMCCNAPPIGSLKNHTLEEILNSSEAKEYRRGLLTANLPYSCSVCPDRCTTNTQILEIVVKQYLDGNSKLLDKMESITKE